MSEQEAVASLAKRFWVKVNKTDGCWLWTAAVDSCGYGRIGYLGKARKSNRVAWFLAHGEWPQPCVLHHCDEPRCVRPDHLFLGTQIENMADMVRKGRSEKLNGERHPHAKLTGDDATEIRKLYADRHLLADIAGRFDITKSAVCHVVARRTWRLVP